MCRESQENPELLILQENNDLELDSTLQTLVGFFVEEFIALLVEQTNFYDSQETAKLKEIQKSKWVSQEKDISDAQMRVFIGLLLIISSCLFPLKEHYRSTKKFVKCNVLVIEYESKYAPMIASLFLLNWQPGRLYKVHSNWIISIILYAQSMHQI